MTLSFVQPARIHASLAPFDYRRNEVRSWTQKRDLSAGARGSASGGFAGFGRKIGGKQSPEKGYSATSRRDSASFLMRAMKVSSGIAPRSLPERHLTAILPSAASR